MMISQAHSISSEQSNKIGVPCGKPLCKRWILQRSGAYCFFSGIDNSPDIPQDPTLKTYIIKDKSGDLTACGIQKQWVIEQGLLLAAPLVFMKVTTCLLLSSHFDTGNSSNNQFG